MNVLTSTICMVCLSAALLACNAPIAPPPTPVSATATTSATVTPSPEPQPTVSATATPSPEPQPLFEDVIDTTALVAYYPLDGTAEDMSGYGNHGTIQDGGFEADRAGQSDGAYILDGQDNYIVVNDAKSLDMTLEMSISVWFYHQSQNSDTWYTLVEKSDPERDGHSRYGIWLIRDLVEVCVQPADLQVPQRCLDSETTLQSGQWHHLVGLSDGQVLQIYIDGQLAGERDFGSRHAISQSNYELFIGTDLYNPTVIYTTGLMDELRLYKRVLNEEEITTLYEAGRIR